MKIIATRTYVGPNIHALFPVIHHQLDLGALEEWPTRRLGDQFIGDLLTLLPGLRDHGCSYSVPGGFIRRMSEDEGTWLGHVMEHVAIELQNLAGAHVSFGKTRSGGQTGLYDMVYEYEEREVGLEAGRIAFDVLQHLLPSKLRNSDWDGGDFDFAAARDGLIRFAQRRAFGPSTGSLIAAAKARDIPWSRLNSRSLLQFGHGRYQKRIQATVTSETRHIAVEIASDKEETARILGDLGLPVPQQAVVSGPRDAVRAAEKIGYPVVVKPLDANHGRGVSIKMMDAEQVKIAFATAQQHSRYVIVESYIEGFDHRMLVVNGQLIAVSKRVPGHVLGDGRQTVKDLVEEVNRDPRRGIGHEKTLTRLEFDEQAERLLAKQGYDKDTVPAKGEVVYLRSTGNLSTGGTAIDVTDLVHPDNREMAVRAIKAIGLDVGGVDFLTNDIAQSYREVGGAICEVNAAPGFRMHVAPSEGTPRDVAKPVMDMLFPPQSPSRIPIAALTGTNGKTTTARMIAHILKLSGHTVGLATTDGVYIDGNLTVKGDMTGPAAAQMILRDPSVDAAVLETARGGLIRRGLGYDSCDVGAVLNVSSDHLGLGGVDSLEQMAHVKRVVVEVAKGTAVLNADDPLCLQMADYTTANHICYITMNPNHALVREHIRAGHRALVLEQGINGQMITLYERGIHEQLLWTHLIPATLEGRALHNVQNAMFAAAISFGLGKKLEDIRHGLRTFDSTFFQTPGRMNIYSELPFKVIVDYGHNPAAIRAMCSLVQRMEPKGRRIVVLTTPGDRRDEDIDEIGAIAAGQFDHYIVRRDDNLRGRAPEEVPQRLRAALRAKGVDDRVISVIPDEQEAVDAALHKAQPGDLLMIFADNYVRSWKQVIYFNRLETKAELPVRQESKISDLAPIPAAMIMDDRADIADSLDLIRDERGVRLARQADSED